MNDRFLGLFIRLIGGEKLVKLPPLVHFPGFEPPSPEEVKFSSQFYFHRE